MENKETLEEAVKYYAHNYFEMHDTNNYKALKQGFEAGAKWQQEQDKKMYSEEDMMFAYEQGARLALISQSDLARVKGKFPTPREWFDDLKRSNIWS
jgi:hypothetical protein